MYRRSVLNPVPAPFLELRVIAPPPSLVYPGPVETEALCPYCFEAVSLWIDVGGGFEQDYVEDCAICCRPCRVIVSLGDDDEPHVELMRE